MNNLEITEVVGVCTIVAFQVFIFYRTVTKISVFRNVFPEATHFEVIRTKLKREFFQLEPRQVLQKLGEYIKLSNPEFSIETLLQSATDLSSNADLLDVDLLGLKGHGNSITDNIFYSINTYLLRNRGAASDFHLIKDIAERNCDAAEEEINQTVSLPLYLGLLGTFMGIVVGLFQISGQDFSSNPAALDIAISLLLGGVKIAMIASFVGLFLTVVTSGYFFKGAKTEVEARKNDFYTFIQTDLLPLLNQNINSTLYSLQNNLHRFNDEFKSNVSLLSGVMGKNHDSLIAQEKILNTLDKMDITAFAKANVVILRELNISTERLSQFNQYLSILNHLISSTDSVSKSMNETLQRTNNLNGVAEKINIVFRENQDLSRFLQNHYSALDESHQKITKAVNNVGATLEDSLDKLKEFTQQKIIEIQKISLSEINLMQNQYPEKWKKLDQLDYLETVSKKIDGLKGSYNTDVGNISAGIRETNQLLRDLTEAINKPQKSRLKNIVSWLSKKV